MKIPLISTACLCIALTASAVSPLTNLRHNRQESKRCVAELRRHAPSKAVKKAPALNYKGDWQPTKITQFVDESGNWEEIGVLRYVYDDFGRIESETYSDGQSVYYYYDDKGRVADEIYFQDDDPEMKFTYGYDTVVEDFVVSFMVSSFSGDDWNTYLGARLEVTRDKNGNVTDGVSYINYGGREYEYNTYHIEYGEDGKASSFITYDYDDYSDERIPVLTYDVEWDRTDGQLFLISPMDYFTDDADGDYYGNLIPFSGANRIKSAREDYPDEGLTLRLEAEYPDDLGSYHAVISMDRWVMMEVSYDVVSDGNGWNLTLVETEPEYDETSGELISGVEDRLELQVRFDDFGILTSYREYDSNEEDTIYRESAVTYDGEHGYPVDVISTDEDGYMYRSLLSDYIRLASASAASTEIRNGSRFFTIDGFPANADCLAPGVYIEHRDGHVRKILVK